VSWERVREGGRKLNGGRKLKEGEGRMKQIEEAEGGFGKELKEGAEGG
jgi:hypothetical protein